MPEHTRGNIYIIVCHTLIVGFIDTVHVYQRIAHLFLSTVDVGIDNTLHALVAHDVDVHGDTPFVGLAGDVRQFLFRPVRDTLVIVRIERVNKSCAAFHRSVHKHLEPVSADVGRLVFLRSSSLVQGLVYIHPAVQFPCRSQYEVHVAGLIHLLSGLIEIVVEEIGRVAVLIHRITLRQQLFLDAGHVGLSNVNGEEVFVI